MRDFLPRLKAAYASITVGDPLAPETLVGPLIDGPAFAAMQEPSKPARALGGEVTGGSASRKAFPRAPIMSTRR